MKIRAFNQCVSVITVLKNEKKYAMTCAWTTQLDEDKIGCLMGVQSTTAHQIRIGDIVGVSVLAMNQKNIALHLGEGHSSLEDKLKNIATYEHKGGILIEGAKHAMVGKVIDIVHLKKMEDDFFITIEIIDFNDNENETYLRSEDVD